MHIDAKIFPPKEVKLRDKDTEDDPDTKYI